MKMIKIILCLYILGIYPAFAQVSPTTSAPQYQWVEFGPNNQWIVKSIVEASVHCPEIVTQNDHISMEAKMSPGDNFPITVCQAVLPNTTTQASINHIPLHLPIANPKTIVIVGSSGSCIKNHEDEERWPYPVIAKEAIKLNPDLIIHVGNYVYSNADNFPTDTWHKWQTEFFQPSKPLLNAAPWIFTRGNHESCDAQGVGFEYLLDPFSFKHCFNRTPIYSVNIGHTNLFVMDSSSAHDKFASPNEINWFGQYFFQMTKSNTKYNWIISHKPIWSIHKNDFLNAKKLKHSSGTLQKAWSKIQPSNINLILSGHILRFEMLNFPKSQPSQVIVGSSGASFDKVHKQEEPQNIVSSITPNETGFSLNRFGFLVMKKLNDDDSIWSAQFYSPQGKILKNCVFVQKKFSCE